MTHGSGSESILDVMIGDPYGSVSMRIRFTGPSVCDAGILLRWCRFLWLVPLSRQVDAGEEIQNRYRVVKRTAESSLKYLKLQSSFLDRRGA